MVVYAKSSQSISDVIFFHCRDIKPENILLTSKDNDINLKLADFGFAAKAGLPILKPNVRIDIHSPALCILSKYDAILTW